jgi:hypothetical protein
LFLDLLLEWAEDVFELEDFFALEDWLRLRRDEAAETTGAHTSASRQIAANAEVKRAMLYYMSKVLARPMMKCGNSLAFKCNGR